MVKLRVDKICEFCSKDFKVYPYIHKLGKGRFCSNKCKLDFNNSLKIEKPCLNCNSMTLCKECHKKQHKSK